MARLSTQFRNSEALEGLFGHFLLLIFHMWSIAKPYVFGHLSACTSHCAPLSPRHWAVLASHEVLDSYKKLPSGPHASTQLHPPDTVTFSRGKSDLVGSLLFSAQSPYTGFHCSEVNDHYSRGGLQHPFFWPHAICHGPLSFLQRLTHVWVIRAHSAPSEEQLSFPLGPDTCYSIHQPSAPGSPPQGSLSSSPISVKSPWNGHSEHHSLSWHR